MLQIRLVINVNSGSDKMRLNLLSFNGVLICTFFSFLSHPATSKELDIAFGQSRPPYIYHELGIWRGIEIDIVRESLRYQGYSFKNEIHVVNKRLKKAVTTMGFDAAVSVQESDDGTYYSDSFITYKNIALSKKKDGIVINNTEDLTKYTTVAWQSAYLNLGPEYEKFFGPNTSKSHLEKYSEFGDQERQNAFFWLGRAQILIVDKYVFQWFRKKLASTYDTTEQIELHDIFPVETHYQVSFKDKILRDDFNQGLKHLKDTGKYQAIIQRYIP